MKRMLVIGVLLLAILGAALLIDAVVPLPVEKEAKAMMKVNKSVLKSSLAGRWYPADAETLRFGVVHMAYPEILDEASKALRERYGEDTDILTGPVTPVKPPRIP